MECSIILGEYAKVRVTNLSKVVVESGKAYPVRMITEIKEQISQLEKKANRANAKTFGVGHDRPTIDTDAHAQWMMHLEAGAIGLKEALSLGFVWGKGSKKELLQNLGRCESNLAQVAQREGSFGKKWETSQSVNLGRG